jgi:hypothetical protein
MPCDPASLQRVVRAARQMADRLDPETQSDRLALSGNDWQQCQRLMSLRSRISSCNWQESLPATNGQLILGLDRLIERLTTLRQHLLTWKQPRPVTIRELYDDLRALEQEFVEVQVDLRNRTLAVTTESIRLEEVDLGAFRIELDWRDMSRDRFAYSVHAVDPYYSHDESTCHPHVAGEHLCEGLGYQALESAKAGGRLLDFFLVIKQILMTYNADSAYVPLDEWHYQNCERCSYSMPHDESSSCSDCGDRLCDECGSTCGGCAEFYCHDCLGTCNRCESMTCSDCLVSCTTCDESFCSECLCERECHACLEKQKAAGEESERHAATPAAVHTVQLGPAAVPAGCG